jgi:hypothetical protein
VVLRAGVRLDLRHVPPGAGITAADIEDALAKIPHELRPGDIGYSSASCCGTPQ